MTKKDKSETKSDKRDNSMISGVKDKIIKSLDNNRDGKIDIEDIIALALKSPGVHVRRTDYLRKEFKKNYSQNVIDKAIATTPAQAGIPKDEIDKIADEVIKFERNCVSGISAALGVPGGWTMAATIPADIVQYYGYTIRTLQKLLYLYGFPEIVFDENGTNLDSQTVNQIILCLGIMNGVAGANNAIKGIAKALATGVEKKLINASLTKGTFYPMIKAIAKWFGIKMTKTLFAESVGKTIPVVGGVVAGGITFFSFKPCCNKLKNVLRDTMLSNNAHISSDEEDKFSESILAGVVIDVNYEEIIPKDD